jgi:hypothetical protein
MQFWAKIGSKGTINCLTRLVSIPDMHTSCTWGVYEHVYAYICCWYLLNFFIFFYNCRIMDMSVFMGSGLVLAWWRKKIKNLRTLSGFNVQKGKQGDVIGGRGSGVVLLVSSFAILVWFSVFSYGWYYWCGWGFV